MKNQEVFSIRYPNYFRYLILATAIMLFLLIVSGGIMRVTGLTGSCLDWPTCLGEWTSPANSTGASIEFMHRLATILVFPFLLVGAVIAWKRCHRDRLVSIPIYTSLILFLAQIVLGALITLDKTPVGHPWLSSVHLGLSLLILAFILIATVIAFYRERAPIPDHGITATNSVHLVFSSPFARFSIISLGAVFLLLVSGSIVSGSQSSMACTNWPLCTDALRVGDISAWINMSHRLLVALVAVLMFYLFIQAWRTQRTQTTSLVSTTVAMVLFAAQALLGAKLVNGFPGYLLVLHQATATAVWASLVILVISVGIAARTTEEEQVEASLIHGRKGLVKDLLMLTKPIVVVLLLVTTFAGMVIGAQAWPPIRIMFWTLLAGFMAAGGSGAINQYIDRYDDSKMQRTQKRPIPAGRLTAGEGLAFGVAMALSAFYVMVALVNLLSALLVLAGIIYYVLIYSIFLKKATVQNIVIGGGAGAIPPLVGWSAVTGSLNFPSLFLFAIVFMWTPPHFWALALVRRKDYARAGVPMLPVIRGEAETRKQIFIYTIELVALTLLLPLFGLGGSIYLVGAIILGIWLMLAAWRVWKDGGNKVAWKMYRYSSMYLAFLFVVLMIDRMR